MDCFPVAIHIIPSVSNQGKAAGVYWPFYLSKRSEISIEPSAPWVVECQKSQSLVSGHAPAGGAALGTKAVTPRISSAVLEAWSVNGIRRKPPFISSGMFI